MKIKGVELQEFLQTGWPQPEDDFYMDHDVFDGAPDPKTTYETDDLGPIQYQGSGEDPTRGEGYDMAKLIRAWRKKRTTEVFTVEVPKDKVEAFKALIQQHGFPQKAGY